MSEEQSREEWRRIVDRYGEESGYEVSSLGRVRSQHLGWEGKILSGGEGPDSQDPKRRKVWLKDVLHPQSRPHSVEKLVARMFHGVPEPGAKIQWINGHVWDNRAENVRWVSPAEAREAEERMPVNSAGFTVMQLRARVRTAEEAVRKAHRELAEAQVALIRGEAEIEAQKGAQG